MKKYIKTILVILLLIVSSITAKETLKVAWYQLPGFSELENNQKYGYNYEFIQNISKFSNTEIQYVNGNWEECLEYLKNGEADIMLSVAYTTERDKYIDYCMIPIGNSTSLLLARQDDERYSYLEINSLKNKTIGAEKGSYAITQAIKISDNNKLNLTIKEYEDEYKVIEALEKKEVDIISISDTNITCPYKLIAESPPYPFYVAISPKKPELQKKIENTLTEIYRTNPSLNEDLKQKYFFENAVKCRLNFTQKELDFIKSNPIIDTYYDHDFSPLGYEDKNGNYKGIISEMLQSISEKTNLKFNLIHTDTYKEATNKVKENPSSIITDLFSDFSWAEENNVYLTSSYLYLPRVQIRLTNHTGAIKTLGVIESYFTNPKTVKKRGYTLKKYENLDECIKALRRGEIDATITNLYNAENLTIGNRNQDLAMINDNGFSQGISIGINKQSPQELFTILNKAINNVDKDKLNTILTENINYKNDTLNFIIQTHSITIAIIFIIFVILISFIILISYKRIQENKNRKIIEKAKNEAIEANLSKTLFLSSMSHDLRTPINAISGMTQLALEDIDNKNLIKESLNIINKSSIHLLQIINDILEISKIEKGTIDFVKKEFKIEESFNYIIDQLIFLAKEKNISVKVKYDIYNNYILSDKNILQRIVENIFNNSIKFTNQNGKIDINIKEVVNNKRSFLQIEISDNGIGMSEKEQKHIFESFYRVQRINVEGTGLGLSIVNRFVKALNGSISVKSKINKGSTFTVNIPALFMTKDTKNCKESKNNYLDKKINKRILLIEDNKINQIVATKMLENLGATVIKAINGNEGFEMFEKNNEIDLICLDIQMPVLNGYETAKLIRKKNKTIPIIGMSANAYTTDIQKAYECGFNDYISKPINYELLKQILSKYI